MPAPHHSSLLQAGCPSCHPTNGVKALKANSHWTDPTISPYNTVVEKSLHVKNQINQMDGRMDVQTQDHN